MNNKIIVQKIENEYLRKTYNYKLIRYESGKSLPLIYKPFCFYDTPPIIASKDIMLDFNFSENRTYRLEGPIKIIKEFDFISINNLYINHFENDTDTFNGKIISNILELILINWNE